MGIDALEELTPVRLRRQVRFLLEADGLKGIERRTRVTDGSRQENSAEHSWHLALMALVLAEHAGAGDLDLPRVLRLLLVHDLVEIDAGDTFCYDPEARRGKEEREERAAERLFGLLPEDQALEIRAAWDEFEARETPEARFANALDRLQPLLLNLSTRGHSWRRHGVRLPQVLERMRPVREGAPELWSLVEELLGEAVERGWLDRG